MYWHNEDEDEQDEQRDRDERDRDERDRDERDRDERDRDEDEQEREREICPDCHGTTLNLIDPEDGGSCPSCFGGYRF
jgi:hypothetical protein